MDENSSVVLARPAIVCWPAPIHLSWTRLCPCTQLMKPNINWMETTPRQSIVPPVDRSSKMSI
jgi:hypothetical protein